MFLDKLYKKKKHDKNILNCSYVIWSWNLYKFKNNYIQTNYTHKVIKVKS